MQKKVNKKRISFVTLYDKWYLSRGLALYRSLKKQCSCNFEIFVLALDNDTYSYLNKVEGINAFTVESVVKEYPVLGKLRSERSYQEFCWTLASFFTQYVMRIYNPDVCCYVDSDLYFWDDPCILINEMLAQNKSVLITEHNYFYKYDQTITSGKFCVQFIPFLNDSKGNEVLEWWRERCEERCSRETDGKTFGDQKYLDDWESRFEDAVYNCKNIGSGIAPWNCVKFSISESKNNKVLKDRVSGVSGNTIFYHYHALRELSDNCWDLSWYDVPDDFRDAIYAPYIKVLNEIDDNLDEDLRFKPLEYKLVDKYLLYPVPYQGIERVTIEHKVDNENCLVLATINGAKTVSVELNILPDGTLRIERVDDYNLFLENIHEIIWRIQTEIKFKTDDLNIINYQILSAIKENRHFKLEWFNENVDDINFEYPIYEKNQLVEILSDNRQYFAKRNLFILK